MAIFNLNQLLPIQNIQCQTTYGHMGPGIYLENQKTDECQAMPWSLHDADDPGLHLGSNIDLFFHDARLQKSDFWLIPV